MNDSLELNRLNRSEAFRYMGYKGGEIKKAVLDLADECEEALLKVIKPRMVYRVFDIEKTELGVEIKNTPLVFEGNDIAEHLEGCQKAVLMCVTLSAAVDRLISSFEAYSMEKAVIADSLASAAVEQVCEKSETAIQREMGDYHYTWRFSPGYGDFPLTCQKAFIKFTDAEKRIGLNVTDSLILVPRKSVTAVMGISDKEIPQKRRGCACCNMNDRCEFRKRGSHCGF